MRLELEITHRCNKMCRLCDHRIATSPYDHLTWGQYRRIRDAAGSDFEKVLFIGGEPLMHPYFDTLAWEALDDIGPVRVATNGKLLPQVAWQNPALFGELAWTVQHYPRWNDDVVAEFGRYANVTVRPWRGFWDPYQDPGLDEDMARWVAGQCLRQVRLVGTRLYRCCLSESIERHYQTGPVHVEFTENWRADWEALPVWRACQHCFRAWNVAMERWRWR